MKYNAEHFTPLKDPMAPYNFQHEAQPAGHDGQNVYDLVFVFFLNFIFHIVLVNVEQPNLQMHRVLSYTTIPPHTTTDFSQLPGHTSSLPHLALCLSFSLYPEKRFFPPPSYLVLL